MGTDKKFVLVATDLEAMIDVAKDLFTPKGWVVIQATSPTELRLKFSNQSFDLIMIDLDVVGQGLSEFVEGIRRKEVSKGTKNVPIVMFGLEAKVFHKLFTHVDTCSFIQKPFTSFEVNEKLKLYLEKPNPAAQGSKKIKKDEYLIREGEQSNEMFWVIKGKFAIIKSGNNDKNIMVGEVVTGELIGEMSFLDDLPRSASVLALEDSEVLPIPHSKYLEVTEKQPKWFKGLMKTLSQRVRNANQIIARRNNLNNQAEEDELKDQEKISGV